MESDALKWDARYKENSIPTKPLELLEHHIAKAQVGKALDIACGMGRNSKFMRDCGFCVDSVDISNYAINALQGEIGINAKCVDLDTFKIPACHYDLICNSYFLERRLFPFIIEGLKKDGILVFETFVFSHIESQNAFVSDSSHLLRKNELLRAFLDLEILFYEEALIEHKGNFSLIARLVAKA
ncbi:methyltransferase domain-containing protein [uncultured Helicobacter sp.]|uniref:class I SAM-dependent methyltransferase n=1 Tax=uncultured Helicobacter sp. TaxID=175537 RepID=UPI002615E1E1|nr:methyltransferase domain-containing protein [uncultured Helicobacter sp.]